MLTTTSNTGWTATTASNATTVLVFNGPPAAPAPAALKPRLPLEWLRQQVDEVCRLARDAS